MRNEKILYYILCILSLIGCSSSKIDIEGLEEEMDSICFLLADIFTDCGLTYSKKENRIEVKMELSTINTDILLESNDTETKESIKTSWRSMFSTFYLNAKKNGVKDTDFIISIDGTLPNGSRTTIFKIQNGKTVIDLIQ